MRMSCWSSATIAESSRDEDWVAMLGEKIGEENPNEGLACAPDEYMETSRVQAAPTAAFCSSRRLGVRWWFMVCRWLCKGNETGHLSAPGALWIHR